jgi:hypothetical protein
MCVNILSFLEVEEVHPAIMHVSFEGLVVNMPNRDIVF